MDKIFGLPAHPLLVHAPVVLLPLGAVGVLLMVIRTKWFERYKWATLVVVGAGMLGAILAAGSGESMEEITRRRAGDHAEAGDAARLAAIIFFAVMLLAVVGPLLWKRWSASRARVADGASAASDAPAQPSADSSAQPMWLRLVVSGALIASAAGSVITVIDAGHSGAERVWENDDDRGDRPAPGYPDREREDDDDASADSP